MAPIGSLTTKAPSDVAQPALEGIVRVLGVWGTGTPFVGDDGVVRAPGVDAGGRRDHELVLDWDVARERGGDAVDRDARHGVRPRKSSVNSERSWVAF